MVAFARSGRMIKKRPSLARVTPPSHSLPRTTTRSIHPHYSARHVTSGDAVRIRRQLILIIKPAAAAAAVAVAAAVAAVSSVPFFSFTNRSHGRQYTRARHNTPVVCVVAAAVAAVAATTADYPRKDLPDRGGRLAARSVKWIKVASSQTRVGPYSRLVCDLVSSRHVSPRSSTPENTHGTCCVPRQRRLLVGLVRGCIDSRRNVSKRGLWRAARESPKSAGVNFVSSRRVFKLTAERW